MIVRMVVTAYGAQHMEYGTVERFAWHGSRASLHEKLGLHKELPPLPAPAGRVSINVVDVIRALVREPTITLTHENRVQIMQAAVQFNQCQIDSKTLLCKIMAVVGKDVLIRCMVSLRAKLANSNAPAQTPPPPSTGKRTREAREEAEAAAHKSNFFTQDKTSYRLPPGWSMQPHVAPGFAQVPSVSRAWKAHMQRNDPKGADKESEEEVGVIEVGEVTVEGEGELEEGELRES